MERQRSLNMQHVTLPLALCCAVGLVIMLCTGEPSLLPLGFFVALVYGGLGLSLRRVFLWAAKVSKRELRWLSIGMMSLAFLALVVMIQLFLGTMLLAVPPLRFLLIFAKECKTGTDMLIASTYACPSALGAALSSIVLNLKHRKTN